MMFYTLCLTALLTALPALAEEFQYKDYEVVKGDTLWGISSKELTDYYQWPLVWKENPDVKNPNRIYPGQKLRIPIGLKAAEEKAIEAVTVQEPARAEVPKAEAPVKEVTVTKEVKAVKPEEPRKIELKKKGFLVERSAYLYAGWIGPDAPNKGTVLRSPTGATSVGMGDEIYIKPLTEVKAGDMFYVVRKSHKVLHPVTKERLGYLIEIIGSLRVESITADGVLARVMESFTEIAPGDRLDDYYEVDLPYTIDEPRKPDIKGFVVTTKQKRLLSGTLDIVYIDRGKKDGLEPGDVLMTISPGSLARKNGIIQIISLKETTSAAVILSSSFEVRPGDMLSGLK